MARSSTGKAWAFEAHEDCSIQSRAAILIQIIAPHFCAGIVLKYDQIIQTAPILYYMKDWSLRMVKDYCRHKKWKLRIIPE